MICSKLQEIGQSNMQHIAYTYATSKDYMLRMKANRMHITGIITTVLYDVLFRSTCIEPTIPGRLNCADMNDNLFANILNNPHRVSHKLQDKTDHTYNLRPRRHPLSLTVKTDFHNFINRLLFNDIH